jgi:hypothetical protein
MYGTCAANCTTMAQWTSTPVEMVGHTDFGFYYTGLALGPTGTLELSYTTVDGRVRHATCITGCAESRASWTPFRASLHSGVESANWITHLAVDGEGKRHLVWIDRDDALRYMHY